MFITVSSQIFSVRHYRQAFEFFFQCKISWLFKSSFQYYLVLHNFSTIALSQQDYFGKFLLWKFWKEWKHLVKMVGINHNKSSNKWFLPGSRNNVLSTSAVDKTRSTGPKRQLRRFKLDIKKHFLMLKDTETLLSREVIGPLSWKSVRTT